jgi:chemotaxis protein MotB
MGTSQQQPIILIRKRSAAHAQHHGGAWKVAYADFVTAMMAFFLVLWLMSSSNEVKQAIAGYFTDPKGYVRHLGTGLVGAGHAISLNKAQMNQLKQKLDQAIAQRTKMDQLKEHVRMSVTSEGLRIELIETAHGMFFENGSADPTPQCMLVLSALAAELGRLTNPIMIEGHTDSTPFHNELYSNWELSADRANAARRLMQANGVHPDQITQVRGYADQQLRVPERPQDPSNRRVSIIVQYPREIPADVAPATAGHAPSRPKTPTAKK